MTLPTHSYWCMWRTEDGQSEQDATLIFILNVFSHCAQSFLVRWLDILWCDSDLKVVTYYGHGNDDSDCCDCVGSNHLTIHWIRIVVMYENSSTSPKIPTCTLHNFAESHLRPSPSHYHHLHCMLVCVCVCVCVCVWEGGGEDGMKGQSIFSTQESLNEIKYQVPW